MVPFIFPKASLIHSSLAVVLLFFFSRQVNPIGPTSSPTVQSSCALQSILTLVYADTAFAYATPDHFVTKPMSPPLWHSKHQPYIFGEFSLPVGARSQHSVFLFDRGIPSPKCHPWTLIAIVVFPECYL